MITPNVHSWKSDGQQLDYAAVVLRLIVEYYEKVAKQWQPKVNAVQEADAAAASDADYNRKPTTKHVPGPDLVLVEDASLTVLLIVVVAVCCVLIIMTLLVLAMFCCRSCRRHAELDEAANSSDALCGNYRLLGGFQRQQTDKHPVDIAIVNDRSPSVHGIGKHTFCLQWRI